MGKAEEEIGQTFWWTNIEGGDQRRDPTLLQMYAIVFCNEYILTAESEEKNGHKNPDLDRCDSWMNKNIKL